jgi:uncharacterized membrane protein
MSTFEVSDVIARSAQDIWSYAAEIERHDEWMTVTNARATSGRGLAVGDRGKEVGGLGPWKWDVEVEVTAADPGRRLTWRSVAGAPFDLEVTLDLTEIDATSTRATYRASLRMRGLWRLIGPIAAMEGAAGPKRELARLKANLEAGTPAA